MKGLVKYNKIAVTEGSSGLEKRLAVLTGAARYDVSCASGGGPAGANGRNTTQAGICHSWAADGRCISLLKLLMTNYCNQDCAYCANRKSNDIPRAALSPDEIIRITVEFYRRNYIEGLFLSSGICSSADDTVRKMVYVAESLRNRHGFGGYIHLKIIPGTDPGLISRAGLVADRLSVNIEMPSEESLKKLAPGIKSRQSILKPMHKIAQTAIGNKEERSIIKSTPVFAPAGQSTQMIIGATPDTDFQIVKLSEKLYDRYSMKRVYYSAYVPINSDNRLPGIHSMPPNMREHRLYQADWLIRLYGFRSEEILSEAQPDLDLGLDPKASWAFQNPQFFPVDVNRADYEMILRVPGIGFTSARKIVQARRYCTLREEHLKKLGVVMKRARFFLVFGGKPLVRIQNRKLLYGQLLAASMSKKKLRYNDPRQPLLFPEGV